MRILSGIINMTYTELSETKGNKMISILSNVEKVDEENKYLFEAAKILESIGNDPGVTAQEFIIAMAGSDVNPEDFPRLSLSAVSIETMMTISPFDVLEEPTIH